MRRLRRSNQKHLKEQAKRRKKLRKKAVVAGTVAAITLGSGLSINKILAAYTPDAHELPVSQDDDVDLLANKEELAIGYRLFKSDQNRNEIPDGAELARRCAAVIDQLPDPNEAAPGETYKWHAGQYGLETCDICSDAVNMGPAGIINPTLGISVDCSLLAQHYMSHGSFNYAGDVYGESRIDVAALVKALELPRECGDIGTVYLPADLNEDCQVNLEDFAELAKDWLESTDP